MDDDPGVRCALRRLFQSAGFEAFEFGLARAFLDQVPPAVPACLILDLTMPDMTGLEVLGILAGKKVVLPAIILTGNADVRSAVQAFKAGAFDYLVKPVGGTVLVALAREAIASRQQVRERRVQLDALAARYAVLTPRERQVMRLVSSGQATRAVTQRLNISPRTVEAHRASVMHKMQAASFVDLVRMAVLLEQDQRPGVARPADHSVMASAAS